MNNDSDTVDPSSGGGAIRILLAEDNLINRRLSLKLLRSLDYHVEGVDNGRKAVAALAVARYDLVLMDCRMPDMDGLEATRVIRDPASPVLDHDLPVIALTAHVAERIRGECREAGMNDCVSKTFDPEAIRDLVERWVPAQEGRAAPSGNRGADLLDRQALLEKLHGDEALAEDILSGFVEDAARQIALIAEALAAANGPHLREHAHKLAGAAGSIHARELRVAASHLEAAGEAGDLDTAEERLAAVRTEYDRLIRYLGGSHESSAGRG